MDHHQRDKKDCCAGRGAFGRIAEKVASYKPLILILGFCVLLSYVLQPERCMEAFMGYFFIFFSLFKFFDLKGFVEGFSTYDVVAKKIKVYGYAYPFVELFLGLGYLTGVHPFFVNAVTVVVMIASGLGIWKSLLSGQKIKCACLGTVLKVPLGVVSALESFGMGAMAAYKLFS